jgi:hypothetical protein
MQNATPGASRPTCGPTYRLELWLNYGQDRTYLVRNIRVVTAAADGARKTGDCRSPKLPDSLNASAEELGNTQHVGYLRREEPSASRPVSLKQSFRSTYPTGCVM